VTRLVDRHDVLLLDLDGTLYRGEQPVEHAPEAVAEAAAGGRRIGYITNNASRSPAEVTTALTELGFPATPDDVVTSAQAAARVLSQRLPAASRVYIVGTNALAAEVVGAGLALADGGDDAEAVVQGHSPTTGWPQLAEACLAIRRGVPWLATNVDATLPTERGELPGNGSMVAALRTATGAEPDVAGKPGPSLLQEAIRRTAATTPLMVGDRLDSDIAAAHAAGVPSLLVLTGVSDPEDVLVAPADQRPDYLAPDLRALFADAQELCLGPRPGWQVTIADGALLLAGSGDPYAALRAMCAVHWAAGGGPVRTAAADDGAAEALRALGLTADAAAPADAPESVTVDPRPQPGVSR
jgi:HAD superfamily hydrolase (TIGR01450 family)